MSRVWSKAFPCEVSSEGVIVGHFTRKCLMVSSKYGVKLGEDLSDGENFPGEELPRKLMTNRTSE